MGRPELDPTIMKQGSSWGYNYNSTEGCNHDTADDKVDKTIDGIQVTLNTPSKMDAPHPKPGSENPGFDKTFWAKAKPQMDTVGEGLLTRKLKD